MVLAHQTDDWVITMCVCILTVVLVFWWLSHYNVCLHPDCGTCVLMTESLQCVFASWLWYLCSDDWVITMCVCILTVVLVFWWLSHYNVCLHPDCGTCVLMTESLQCVFASWLWYLCSDDWVITMCVCILTVVLVFWWLSHYNVCLHPDCGTCVLMTESLQCVFASWLWYLCSDDWVITMCVCILTVVLVFWWLSHYNVCLHPDCGTCVLMTESLQCVFASWLWYLCSDDWVITMCVCILTVVLVF